jgi:hypothetical protein
LSETAWAQTDISSDENLREAIRLIQSGTSLDKALGAAQQAGRDLPKSHLANFLQYQAYISMAGGDPNQAPPAVKSSPNAHRELVNESKARGKLVSVPKGAIPSAVIQIGPGTDTVLLVESERSRLWILNRKGDSIAVVANHYVTVGQQGVGKEREGDRKTPLGVYRILSEIPGAKLIDFYGHWPCRWTTPTRWIGHRPKLVRGSGFTAYLPTAMRARHSRPTAVSFWPTKIYWPCENTRSPVERPSS